MPKFMTPLPETIDSRATGDSTVVMAVSQLADLCTKNQA